jgi:23S rRNA-/tRNA-specific pseudouridylate synthase
MRLLVRASDGTTVRDVLAGAGLDAVAVHEGRVFLDKRRVTREDERVTPGSSLEIAPALPGSPPTVRILLRERDLVAADKPAGIPTIPDHAGSAHALLARVAHALSVEPSRLHPTSRLDREVSGVVFFALTKAAAERLARARTAGAYERRYIGICARPPTREAGTWDAPIGRTADPRLRAARGHDPVAASTRYVVSAMARSGGAMLALEPLTGRTHQIRVHAADAGAPLVGDRDYGGPARVTLPTGRVLEPGRIALHAARVVVPGATGKPLIVRSPIPPELEGLWSALGGEPSAWELSASCALA